MPDNLICQTYVIFSITAWKLSWDSIVRFSSDNTSHRLTGISDIISTCLHWAVNGESGYDARSRAVLCRLAIRLDVKLGFIFFIPASEKGLSVAY